MTWIWICLGILGLLSLLLLSRVTFRLSFQMGEDFSGQIRYLFLHFSFPIQEKPEKEKPKKKTEKKKKPDKKTSIRDIIQEKGLFGFLEFLSHLAAIAANSVKRLMDHFQLKELKILVSVASEDAATTAVLYGSVGSVVYPAAGTLITAFHCTHYNVQVIPDFEQKDSSAQLYLHGSVRLVFVLAAMPYALLRYLKASVRQKLREDRPSENDGKATAK